MIFSKKNLSILFIIVFHIVGFLGLIYGETKPLFISLVPYHLLLMAGILIANFKAITAQTVNAIIMVAFTGFVVEVIGVQTGIIFGHYSYGQTLGYKILSTPLLIGVNWFIVVFSVGGIMRSYLKKNKILRTFLGAIILVALDFLIEPIAIKFDYWSWQNNIIPLQNYVGWFFVSLAMMAFFNYYNFKKTNSVYKTLIITQFLFFIALNIASIK